MHVRPKSRKLFLLYHLKTSASVRKSTGYQIQVHGLLFVHCNHIDTATTAYQISQQIRTYPAGLCAVFDAVFRKR